MEELKNREKEFDLLFAKDISNNPYLTIDIINAPINKIVYVSLKPKDIDIYDDTVPVFIKFELTGIPSITYMNYYMFRKWSYLYPMYEFWTIPNTKKHIFSHYLVSTDARVWSLISNKLMSQKTHREDRYTRIGMYSDDNNIKQKKQALHILVMASFLPKICKTYPYVNHKNGKKNNGKLFNIEPSNPRHNILHSQEELKNNKNHVPIKRYLLNRFGEYILDKEYPSRARAATDNFVSPPTISYYIKKKLNVNIDKNIYFFTRDKNIRQPTILENVKEEYFKQFKELT